MNRVILLGNGFDLAHGLKTSYNDFIKGVWRDILQKILEVNGSKDVVDEAIFTFTYGDSSSSTTTKFKYCIDKLKINDQSTYKEVCDKFEEWNEYNSQIRQPEFLVDLKIKNRFLQELLEKQKKQDWVDIEMEYYRQLKISAAIQNKKDRIESIKTLNNEFSQIKELLDKYLQEVQGTFSLSRSEAIEYAKNMINCLFYEFLDEDFNDIKVLNDIAFPKLKRCIENPEQLYSEIAPFFKNYSKTKSLFYQLKSYILEQNKNTSLDSFIAHYYTNNNKKHLNLLCKPDNILFLNFNYTQTISRYIYSFQANYIHGEVNQKGKNKPNPMIFGYGDELSEDYKKLENLNENDVLENVKSIRYLEASNYRDLLSFIESDQYQIYIMGHSCGISDRTLLNTLFEHKNCVSIKPFYYKWKKDGIDRDNYRELIQNISRNFNDKRLMRSRVVNKMDCIPLPQAKKL